MILTVVRCWLTLVLSASMLTAQRYVIESFKPDDGLASNQTYQCLQDKNGYLWFACTGGLSRFDGYGFMNFTIAEGLSHNAAISIAEDRHGQLWVGTDAGLNCLLPQRTGAGYTEKQPTIETFPYLRALEKAAVTALSLDEDQKLWIGTRNKGLFILDISLKGDTAALAASLNAVGQTERLDKKNIYKLVDDGLGHIWVCCDGGLYSIDKINFHCQLFQRAQGLKSNDVLTAFKDDQLTLWIGTTGGLNFLDLQSRSIIRPERLHLLNNLSDPVYHVIRDYHNRHWIATNNGVWKFEDGTLTRLSAENGLTDNFIRYIYEDRERLLWFATDGAGINHLVTEKFSNYTPASGLPSKVIRSFTEDERHRIWIGTSKGLAIYDSATFKTFVLGPMLMDNSIWVIRPAPNRSFWIGTENGVARVNFYGSILRKITQSKGLVDNHIRDLMDDGKGNLWIATQFGLSVMDMLSNRIYNYTTENGLPADYIRSLSRDVKGNIWLGTRGGGLCRVLSRTEDVIAVQAFTTQNGFPNNTISKIISDDQGRLWVATHAGAVVLNPLADTLSILYHITIKEGLADNLVSTILADTNNHYWICGDKGVSQIRLTENHPTPVQLVRQFNKRNGLVGDEFTTHNSIFRDHAGNIWFGLFDGLTIYHPDKDVRNTVPPLIYITGVSVVGGSNERPVRLAAASLIQNSFTLQHDQNNLNFEYGALTFYDTKQARYQYRLEGFDHAWSAWTEKREVRYTNLQDGIYTFKVRARNADGVPSATEAFVSFRVHPAFWESWWFRSLMILGLAVLIYSAYQWRTYQIRSRNLELQQRIRESTQTLEERNQQLREVNKYKDDFLNIVAHDLRNPLNSIMCTTRLMLEDYAAHSYEIDKYFTHDVESINRASHHMLELINNLLDLAKIESGKITLNLDQRDLAALIREQVDSIRPVANEKNIRIDFSTPVPNLYARIDKEKIWQALNNLLSNAIKFTDPGGQVQVTLYKTNGQVTVSVEDTGRGIPPDKLYKVFDKFSELSRTGTSGERGTGLGLAITKSIIELHGGTITVESQVNRGTRFDVTLNT